MKNTKRRFLNFAFYDKTGIQNYLEQQAEKGWILDDISKHFWKFRRAEPKKLCFSVTYFPEASSLDFEISKELEYFQDFCAHTGWQLAVTNSQMQIFYNESENPIPIDTDASLEIANIHKSVKKRSLTDFCVGLVFIFMFGGLSIYRLLSDPFQILFSNFLIFAILILILISILYLTEIFEYFSWYRKAKAAAKRDGSFVETNGHSGFYYALLWFMLADFILILCSFGSNSIVMTAMISICPVLVIAGIISAILSGKKKKISAVGNRAITNMVFLIFPYILSLAILIGNFSGWNLSSEKSKEHEYGFAWNMYNDELPLYVEDVTDTGFDGYSCSLLTEESVLLIQSDVFQRPLKSESEVPNLEYTVTKVKIPVLYDWFLRKLMKNRVDWFSYYGQTEFKPIDEAGWNANEAYQLCSGSDSYNVYLLCYDDRIIEVRPSWEPTAEQKEIISEKLNSNY